MDELRFVLKCFLFACLLFAGSQYRLDNGVTVEARVHEYLVSSQVAEVVNDIARGGAKAFREFSKEAVGFFNENRQITPHRANQKKQVDTEDDIDLD